MTTNSSGLVGRNLMLHPLSSVVGFFDESFDAWRAHAGALIHSLEFANSDASRGFVRGATWSLASSGTPLGAAFGSGGEGCWGAGHHAFVRERFGRTASWILITEDLPDPDNRVELSPTLRDDAGLAAPRIVYRLSENTHRLIAWHGARARESLEAAGAQRTEVLHYPANGHLLGTARMGRDREKSVVNPDCRAHDVKNLLIPDGSVFVTAGSANPTTTIAAIALRAADRLIAARAAIPRPAHRTAVAMRGAAVPAGSVVRAGAVATTGAGAAASRASAPTGADPNAPRTGRPSEAQRAKLRALADQWIPAGPGMPAASAAGAADVGLDRVLAARPDLAEPVHQALAEGDEPSEAALRTLRFVVAAAYYLSPSVRRALHFDPENVTPVRPLDLTEIAQEGLLDHLLEAPT